jgi:hypothetical protein
MIRQVVISRVNSSLEGPVGRLIGELQDSSKGVSVPNSFGFLKSLSNRYADTLREMIFTRNF